MLPGRVSWLRRLGLFVAVAFVTRAVLLGVAIIDLDEAAYLVGGWEWFRGRRLYAEIADHKPPLVFAYFGFAQWLLGRGMLSVRLLTHVVTVPLTALAASAFYRHDRRGLLAGLALLVYGTAFLGHDVLSINCELLMLLPLAWALVLVRDREAAGRLIHAVAAGLLVGIAMLFKYQAAAWLPAVALVAARALPRAGLRRGLAVLAAGAAPALVAWAVFAGLGSGADFVYWNWSHNLGYVEHAPSAAEALQRAAAYLLPFLLVTAPLWWLATGARKEDAHRDGLLGSILVLAAAAALLGGRFYPHYFVPLYLPLALAAAPELERRLPTRSGRILLATTAFLWVAFTAANAYLYYARSDVYVETRPVFGDVTRRLARDPCFGRGPLFVWGFAPQFYSESGLAPATRFLFIQSTLVGHVSGRSSDANSEELIRPEAWEWLMADLSRHPPSYVLDTSGARLSRWRAPLEDYPRLAAFVAAGYEPLDVVDGVRLYKKRGCKGAGP